MEPGSAAPWPAAVLWDMDGTLVDTEPYWIESQNALAAEFGAGWTDEQAMQLVGSDLITSGEIIREQMGLDLTPLQIVERLLDSVIARIQHEVPWRPGARELLAELARADVPTALVTMSWRRFVDPILAALPPGSFTTTVVGDEVAKGKPHPEPYLAAARALGVDAERCIAIEDSGTGARSARAAGCRVVVVPLHVAIPAAPGQVSVETLAGLSPDDLVALARQD